MTKTHAVSTSERTFGSKAHSFSGLMNKTGFLASFAIQLFLTTSTFATLPLRLSPERTHDLDIKILSEGHYQITTTGKDPFLYTEPFPESANPRKLPVLSFETFALKAIDSFQIFLLPPTSERQSLDAGQINSSEGWVPFSIDLSKSEHWRKGKRQFRLDFGRRAGITFQLRSLQLRPFSPSELNERRDKAEKAEFQRKKENWWDAYLKANFLNRVQKVVSNRETITLDHEASEPLLLAEIKPWQSLQSIRTQHDLLWYTPITKGENQTVVKRFPNNQKTSSDRLHSRWVLFRKNGNALQLASHASYCTDQSEAALKAIPVPEPKTKKGLPITWRPGAMNQLDELGIGHGTINIDICNLVRVGNGRPFLTHQYLGRSFRINKAAVDHLSQSLRFAAERNYLMGAIILVGRNPPPELKPLLLHPDYLPNGIYSMANLTTPESCLYYGMIIDFLASHFSSKENGFLHYWIIHNEVDAAWVWTNCGQCGPRSMMDSYVKSMRMVFQAVRQYNPKATVHISLTHFWNKKNVHGPADTMYAPRNLLEILNKHGQAEGDFEWGVAYHPYPQNLRDPRVWEDQVGDNFKTSIISYKNLEVLPAYLRQTRFLYRDRLRKIYLTEQGLSNPNDSPEQLEVQAAAVAYAMKKVNATEGIKGHILHRWVDHVKEGGLNLGLVRKKPGSICTAGEKKPSFDVYAAIDTPREEEACRFALKIIGIPSWNHIFLPRSSQSPSDSQNSR